MDWNWQKLIDVAPYLAGLAMNPGSPRGSAYLEALSRSQEMQQQQRAAQQEANMKQAERMSVLQNRYGEMEARQAAGRRADVADERAAAELALKRLTASRGEDKTFLEALKATPETALPQGTEPLQAQNKLVEERFKAQQAYGIPAGTPQGPLPNMTALVSEGQRRRAKIEYGKAFERYGAEAMAHDKIKLQSPEFGAIHPSELLAKFETPALTAEGQPATPFYKPTETAKPVMRINARTGKMEQIGEAPTGAHFVNEPGPPSQQTVVIQTVDDKGNPITRIVPKTVGSEFKARLNATTANRVDSAVAVNQTGNDLIGKLSDPSFAAAVGPAMGRASTIRDFIGNPPPEFAELAGTIESYALANMGVHGMRSSIGAEHIKKLLDQHHTPASLIAAIRGLNRFSEHFIENAGRPVPVPSAAPLSAEDLLNKYRH